MSNGHRWASAVVKGYRHTTIILVRLFICTGSKAQKYPYREQHIRDMIQLCLHGLTSFACSCAKISCTANIHRSNRDVAIVVRVIIVKFQLYG